MFCKRQIKVGVFAVAQALHRKAVRRAITNE
jgi:hypothetical protein